MAEDGDPPNVLSIVVDAARADEVDTKPGSARTTPNVARLADDGVAFERALSPANWTLPSVTSLLTGLDPHEHGATSRGFGHDRGRTLQRELGEAGYRTVHVSPTTWIGDWLPQGRGFDVVREFTGPEHQRFDAGADVRRLSEGVERGWPWYRTVIREALASDRPLHSLANAAAYVYSEARHDAWLDDMQASQRAADIVADELSRARSDDQPVFVYVHLMDPHLPFFVPEPARSDVRPPGCDSWSEEVAWMRELMADIWAIRNGDRRLTEPELAYLRTRYRDELAIADDAVGRMLDALAEEGLVEDTLVALTADHGEHLGEGVDGRTMLDHQASLRLPVLHVPLVLRLPDRFEDERREQLVRPHDLAATIRRLAGLRDEPSPLADGGEEDRVALAAYRGVVPSHPPEGQRTPFLQASRVTAVTGEWKLDAVADDREDGWPTVGGTEDVDRAVRIDWAASDTEEVPLERVPKPVRRRAIRGMAELGGLRGPAEQASTEAASPALRRRLRRLGYLG